jgi:MFS transporter, ACS family, tartrate transporter
VIGYLVSYLDRINISFAALGMESSFGLSPLAYGFAAGIFYIGYILAEVPSNIIMLKVGARIWLTRIMISWGVVAAMTAFSPNTTTLFVLRFLLGVAEAGFFPGIILYLRRSTPFDVRQGEKAECRSSRPARTVPRTTRCRPIPCCFEAHTSSVGAI